MKPDIRGWRLRALCCHSQRQGTVKVYGGLNTNFGEIAVECALAGHGIVLRSEWDVAPFLLAGRLERVMAPWGGITPTSMPSIRSAITCLPKPSCFWTSRRQKFADQRALEAGNAQVW